MQQWRLRGFNYILRRFFKYTYVQFMAYLFYDVLIKSIYVKMIKMREKYIVHFFSKKASCLKSEAPLSVYLESYFFST